MDDTVITILVAVGSNIIGGLITLVVAKVYYERATRDLNGVVQRLEALAAGIQASSRGDRVEYPDDLSHAQVIKKPHETVDTGTLGEETSIKRSEH